MTQAVLPGALWFITASAAALFAIFYPIILAGVLSKRLKVGTQYAGMGALIFFLFQVISRIPLVSLISPLIAPALRTSFAALLAWLVVLALTAGLFEEVGRYVGYRWLMRRQEKTWEKAVIYGVGHGGLESILLVGVSLLTTVGLGLALLVLPPAALPKMLYAQLALPYRAVAATPGWFPLLALWERLWTLPVHIALSVVVVQVFRRGQLRWLWFAILAHALVDFTTVAIQLPFSGQLIAAALVPEALVAVFGLLALWVIRALRFSAQTPGAVTAAPVAGSDPQQQFM